MLDLRWVRVGFRVDFLDVLFNIMIVTLFTLIASIIPSVIFFKSSFSVLPSSFELLIHSSSLPLLATNS